MISDIKTLVELIVPKKVEFANFEQRNKEMAPLRIDISDSILRQKMFFETFIELAKDPERTQFVRLDKFLYFSISNKQNLHEIQNHHYPYIPYSDILFIRFCIATMKKVPFSDPISFIDVGSGYGTKSLLFKFLFPSATVYGIEYNPETYYTGQHYFSRLYEDLDIKLIRKDAFKYDFGKHNFVYMYHPIHDYHKQMKLYKHVINTMPDNSMLLEVYKQDPFFQCFNIKNDFENWDSNGVVIKNGNEIKYIPHYY